MSSHWLRGAAMMAVLGATGCGDGQVTTHTSTAYTGHLAVASCMAGRLRLSLTGPLSGQTGEHGQEFVLTNKARNECALEGYPQLSLYAGARRLPFVVTNGGSYINAHPPTPSVTLAPGGHAYFLAVKYRCDGQVLADASAIRVRLPGGNGVVRHALSDIGGVSTFAYCKQYPGDLAIDPGNEIGVSSFTASTE